jgi:hypothetical protein
MSKQEKLIRRFLSKPTDFTLGETVALLRIFGYKMTAAGKTGGSRVKFIHPVLPVISLHKPHPRKIMKSYQLDQIEEVLIREGLIDEA